MLGGFLGTPASLWEFARRADGLSVLANVINKSRTNSRQAPTPKLGKHVSYVPLYQPTVNKDSGAFTYNIS